MFGAGVGVGVGFGVTSGVGTLTFTSVWLDLSSTCVGVLRRAGSRNAKTRTTRMMATMMPMIAPAPESSRVSVEPGLLMIVAIEFD